MSQGTEEYGEIEEEAQGTEPVLEDDGYDDDGEPETAAETAERVIREHAEAEAAAEAGEGAQESAEEEEAEDYIEARPGRPKKGEEIEPPHYLSLEEKEEFNSLPRKGKRMVHNALLRHQRKFTEVTQRASAAVNQAKEYDQHATVYLNQHPELVERGYTGPRLMSELLGTHMTLTGKDREAARARYAQMGQQLGFDVSSVVGEADASAAPQTVDISNHPDFIALQQQVGTAHSYVTQQQQAQRNAVFGAANVELNKLREAKSADGKYLYPTLHDDGFVKRIEPVVFDLARTMSWADAIQRAYNTYAPQPAQVNSPQVNQATLPANNRITRQAAQAAVSVRGKSAAPANGTTALEVPESALGSATETAAWIVNNGR